MAADQAGNDVTLVGIPVTGFMAYAIGHEVAIPTPVEGKAPTVTLAQGFVKVGLLTEDGGFEWDEEPDGDPIVFWQDGYQVPTGKGNATLKFTTAENSAVARKLRTGTTPDANGYLTVDAGGTKPKITVYTEEIYANGAIRRRVARGQVSTAKVAKSERGSVQGTEFEISALKHADFTSTDNPTGGHYGEWVINPDAVVVPEP